MGAIVTDGDLTYLQSLYPYADVRALTGQQEQFVLHYLKGASIPAAERAAGYMPGGGKALLAKEHVQLIIELLREKTFADIKVTRELLTQMLFEAHAHSADATEEIKAIVELGKMHGLYESDKRPAVQINVQNNTINNIKQIERLDDEKLIELAGGALVLEPTPIEAEADR